MNSKFQDKVAIVTGGTSGIGAAAAQQLSAQGAKVVVSGRREKEGHEVAESITKAGGTASFFKADTSREGDVKALVEFAVKTYGGLNYAFNNAGVEGTIGLMTDQQTEENYRHTFDINVMGLLFSLKYELPAIVNSGGGAVVNTSSVVGLIGMAGVGVYTASKHAVIGLSRSAALEFASKAVRVNVIAPGTIETPMIDRFAGEKKEGNSQREWLASQHPVGRLGTPDEAAAAAISLLENPFVTGAVLTVDGGWTAR